MAGSLALPLVASLLQAAAISGEVGLRAEARSTSTRVGGEPAESGVSGLMAPRVGLIFESWRLQLTTQYTPQVWTENVDLRAVLQVNHVALARLETSPDVPWHGAATATAVVGQTSPTVEAVRSGNAAGVAQVPSLEPIWYEEFHLNVDALVPAGERMHLGLAAGWHESRALAPGDRDRLPEQRSMEGRLALTAPLTERNSLRLSLRASQADTGRPTGVVVSSFMDGLVAFRRAFTPLLAGWVGGGATLSISGPLVPTGRYEYYASGEVGLEYGGARYPTTHRLVLTMSTFVDRYSGDMRQMAGASYAMSARPRPGLTLAASASGGARVDGNTRLARVDGRVVWTLREHLATEIGVLGRLQDERRAGLPSYVESVVYVGIVYSPGRVFGVGTGAGEAAPAVESTPGTGPATW